MARPRKQGLDYFPFDVDFFSDEKTVCIAGEFGLKGEITMIKLLCAVYRNGYFIEWNDMVRMKLLHSLPGVSAELLDQIVARLVRWGFFCRSLFDTAKVLTSEGIQRRYFDAAKFRIKDDQLPYLLIGRPPDYGKKTVSQEKTTVSQGITGVSQWEMPQNKKRINKKRSSDDDQKKDPPPSPPVSSDHVQFQKLDFAGRLQLLKAETAWMNAIRHGHHLSGGELSAIIDGEFATHCIREGKDYAHADLRDLKSHVSRWLLRRKNTNKQQTDETQRQDRLSRRRGIDPSDNRAEDYKTTF